LTNLPTYQFTNSPSFAFPYTRLVQSKLTVLIAACAVAVSGMLTTSAQGVHAVPRPPAAPPGPPPPEAGSAAPDGYAPTPQWLGRPPPPRRAKPAAYDVQTVAEGLSGAFCFAFLPDNRIIIGERPGRIKIVNRDGTVSEPITGLPSNLWTRGQGLFEVRPDHAFATNRRIYLTYTV